MKFPFCVLLMLFGVTTCRPELKPPSSEVKLSNAPAGIKDKIDGLNFVAPPKPFAGDPMLEVKAVEADWIAVIPYAYTRTGRPSVYFNSEFQWWGERPEGARKTIKLAKKAGIRVMLKPQVYIPGSWPGALNFHEKSDWEKWEAEYREFILLFAEMAAKEQTEMFCIGTEFKISVRTRPRFWRKLIKEVKAVFKGKLVYAANWDDYREVPFWDEMDYIGIDAYFPLVNADTPSVEALKNAWSPIAKEMEVFSKKEKKQILFTEYGYLSVDGCAWRNWELESVIEQCRVNQPAQANALQGLFETFWKKDFWAGGFIWKWFPEGEGHEGFKPKDYTPQGKAGEQVLQDWYGRENLE